MAAEELNDLLLLIRPFFAWIIGQEINYGHVAGSMAKHLSGTTQLAVELADPV